MRFFRRQLLIFLLASLPSIALRAETVAISSVVFNGYAREKLPDGTYKPETYSFGEGGAWTRPIADSAMAKLTFADVIRTVAVPLAKINYRPALKSAEAQLLILVFWGSTEGSRGADNSQSTDRTATALSAYNRVKPTDPTAAANDQSPEADAAASALWQQSLANAERDSLDDRNARIVGYTEAVERARSARHMSFAQDTLAEISDNRYYVVLQAFDFQVAHKTKKLKPLWTTRMSVSEGGAFAPALAQMLSKGANYFGKDSHGLQRRRGGTVDLAPMKVLDVVPDTPAGPDARAEAEPPPQEKAR